MMHASKDVCMQVYCVQTIMCNHSPAPSSPSSASTTASPSTPKPSRAMAVSSMARPPSKPMGSPSRWSCSSCTSGSSARTRGRRGVAAAGLASVLAVNCAARAVSRSLQWVMWFGVFRFHLRAGCAGHVQGRWDNTKALSQFPVHVLFAYHAAPGPSLRTIVTTLSAMAVPSQGLTSTWPLARNYKVK